MSAIKACLRRLAGAIGVVVALASAHAQPIDSEPVPQTDCVFPISCPVGSDICCITGGVPTGTYTFSNKDLVIYNATIVPRGTNRTLAIKVYNGSITVGQVPFGPP